MLCYISLGCILQRNDLIPEGHFDIHGELDLLFIRPLSLGRGGFIRHLTHKCPHKHILCDTKSSCFG